MNMRKLIGKYLHQPYELGKMDCLALILSMAEDLGLNHVEELDGVTPENYVDLWIEDRGKAEAIFSKFISTLGEEVPPHKAFCGDILELRAKQSGEKVFGIHAGQTLVLTALEDRGVDLLGLRLFDIEKAVRWVKP